VKEEKSFMESLRESASSILQKAKVQYNRINHALVQWWMKFKPPVKAKATRTARRRRISRNRGLPQ
ncbi:hypothetical protein GCK32_000839, partial [Trichostrongylus colubriformis]